MNYFLLEEAVGKYYQPLQDIINELASRCWADSEATLNFPAGSITIKLK